MTNMETIQILLKEYDTLRAELITKGTQLFQWFALVGLLLAALLSWVGTHGWKRPLLWIALALFAAGLTYIRTRVHLDVLQAAARVRELEKEVNSLAGAELLIWETRYGRAKQFKHSI